jgi:Zn/Cd-binding protein ZinT
MATKNKVIKNKAIRNKALKKKQKVKYISDGKLETLFKKIDIRKELTTAPQYIKDLMDKYAEHGNKITEAEWKRANHWGRKKYNVAVACGKNTPPFKLTMSRTGKCQFRIPGRKRPINYK